MIRKCESFDQMVPKKEGIIFDRKRGLIIYIYFEQEWLIKIIDMGSLQDLKSIYMDVNIQAQNYMHIYNQESGQILIHYKKSGYL